MNYIKLNDKEYEVESITGGMLFKDGQQREAVTFTLKSTNYTFEEVKNVFLNMSDEFEILNEKKELQGVHKNYKYLDKIEYKIVTLGNVETNIFEITVYSTTEMEQTIKIMQTENQNMQKDIADILKLVAGGKTL